MELIKITEQNGKKAVSARELYEFLGFNKSQWKRWYSKNITKNPYAEESIDWQGFDIMSSGNETKDFALSIDFAKRLSMLARTDKGEQARQYFIACEKQLKEATTFQIPQTLSEALRLAAEQAEVIEKQQLQIESQKPKVLFADAVEMSENSCLIGELAKILKQNGIEIGQNRLFEWMRDNGFLCSKGELYNQPAQSSMELGLFELVKRTINNPDGSVRTTCTTKVTGKGQIYFVEKFLKKRTA